MLVLAVLVALCQTMGRGQTEAKPLTEEQVLKLLRGDVASVRVAQLARERGIDFTLSPDDERRLRRAGAGAALIEALRELAPKAVAPEPVIKLFTADPTSLSPSALSATLLWSVSNAAEVSIEPNIGRVNNSSRSWVVSPAKTTTYTLYAQSAAHLLGEAADEGSTDAMADLGGLYATGGKGVRRNYSEAMQEFVRAAKGGTSTGFTGSAICMSTVSE
jgi:hypothetical protein